MEIWEINKLRYNEALNCTTKGGRTTSANLEDRSKKVLRVRVLEAPSLGLAYRRPVGAAGCHGKEEESSN